MNREQTVQTLADRVMNILINPQKVVLKVLLKLCLLLIVVYLINTLIFFTDSIINPAGYYVKPVSMYITKWFYAALMLFGIVVIDRKEMTGWIILNIASVNVLLLWFVGLYTKPMYHTSIPDTFLLELVAFCLMIILNLKVFLRIYGLKRSFPRMIGVLSVAILCLLLSYLIIPQ